MLTPKELKYKKPLSSSPLLQQKRFPSNQLLQSNEANECKSIYNSKGKSFQKIRKCLRKGKNCSKNESKKVDVLWTFEEEYLFFETHKILKNKWTKYSDIFPETCKEMKELKNHFHSCIIKTVRRIINNKYDHKIKEIMRSFYSCEYLKYMSTKMEQHSQFEMPLLSKTKYKYNPKMLIQQKVLTIESIQNYCNVLLNDFLMTKPALNELLGILKVKKEDITLQNIFFFFSFLIKTKIIIDCEEYFNLISPRDQPKIQAFLAENSNNAINYLKIKDIFSI